MDRDRGGRWSRTRRFASLHENSRNGEFHFLASPRFVTDHGQISGNSFRIHRVFSIVVINRSLRQQS